jgi:acyl-[acyl-carrier-protein]-phospholipid O-acyltransferase / long-chain-fatty-acid--[acyl-carrier-protein] ligase
VMLSHHNIMSNLEAIAQILWIQPDDRMMGVLPFFHSFGFTGTLCVPLVCGIGAIYHPNPLDAKTIGKLAGEHQATILISTPTFCQAYYRTCGPEDFKSLRHVVVGAERLRPDFAAQFKEKFGLEMLEGYGCTGRLRQRAQRRARGRAAARPQAGDSRPSIARRDCESCGS